MNNFIKYLKPSFYLSYILFYLGHWLSIIFRVEPGEDYRGIYTLYNKLMKWSSWMQGRGDGPWQTIVLSEDELEEFLKNYREEDV